MTFSFFRQSYLTQLGSLKRGSRDENNGMKIVLNEPKRNIIVNFRQKRTEGQQLFKEKMAVENLYSHLILFFGGTSQLNVRGTFVYFSFTSFLYCRLLCFTVCLLYDQSLCLLLFYWRNFLSMTEQLLSRHVPNLALSASLRMY